MKKIFFTALMGAMMISCSRDNDNTNPTTLQTPATNEIGILPTKLTFSQTGKADKVTTFSYNGNKLVKVTNGFYDEIFTYTGDLITSMNYTDEYSFVSNFVFNYDSNGNLISEKSVSYYKRNIIFSEYDITYTINGSTVTAQSVAKNYSQLDGVLSSISTSTITYTLDEKKRPIKRVEVYEDKDLIRNTTSKGTKTFTFQYPNHHGFSENIKGMDKLSYSSFAIGFERVFDLYNPYSYMIYLPFSYIKEDINSTTYHSDGFSYRGFGTDEFKTEYVVNAHNYPTRIEYKSTVEDSENRDNGYFTVEYNK